MALGSFDGAPQAGSQQPAGYAAGAVARGVLRQQIGALLACEAGVLRGTDPEELHDMRVASRRIRAALRFFQEVLPQQAADAGAEARWLTGMLGHARDLDVQVQRVRSAGLEVVADEREGMELLLAELERQAADAHGQVKMALGSARYADLLQALTALAEAAPQPEGPSLAQIAPRLITREYRKLRKAGRRLAHDRLPPSETHAIRIRAKHLRYGVEFCLALYGEPAARYVRRLVRLQDAIGAHHDALVLVETVTTLVRLAPFPIGPSAAYTLGMFAERLRSEAARQETRFPGRYRRAHGLCWRRLRATFEAVAGDD